MNSKLDKQKVNHTSTVHNENAEKKTRKFIFKATRKRWKGKRCLQKRNYSKTDFLAETVKGKRENFCILQVLTENNYPPDITFSLKNSFKNKDKIMIKNSLTKTEGIHHQQTTIKENSKVFLKKIENDFREEAENTCRNEDSD